MNILARRLSPAARPAGADLPTRFDQMFNTMLRGWPLGFSEESLPGGFPVDVEETDHGYLLRADLPGVEKDLIEINLDSDMLNISVRRKSEKEEKQKNWLYRERFESSSQRTVHLPNVGPESAVEARLEQGVLTVTVDKTPEK